MHHFVFTFLALGLTFAAPLVSQAPPIPSKTPSALTVESILSLVKAGISDDLVIARIRKEGRAFDLSPEQMVQLKRAGLSDGVLKAMLDPSAPLSAPPASVPAPPVPVIGFPVNPSGATPPPAASVGADENDPHSPHDSGIWLYTEKNDVRKMTVLERAAYQGSKTGGVLTSVLTYGIKKAKSKAIIPGGRASIRTTDARPIFYFYFEDKAAGLGKSYFGIQSLSNPNQFALVKLEVTKSNRQTIIAEFGALGVSSGTHANSMIPFKSERLRSGLYRVVPTAALEPGEYCFLASSGIAGAYGAGAAGAMDIFDFGVIPAE